MVEARFGHSERIPNFRTLLGGKACELYLPQSDARAFVPAVQTLCRSAHENQLARLHKLSRLELVKIHTAGQGRCIETHLMNTSLSLPVPRTAISRPTTSYTLSLTTEDWDNSYLMVVLGLKGFG